MPFESNPEELMNRRKFVKTLPALTLLAGNTAGLAQEAAHVESALKPIPLPKPEATGASRCWRP